MAEKARKQLATDGKKNKRKGSDDGKGAAKKAKLAALDKAIFVQPPNLASDCNLKDYQLEGVRWLASLFENGVSGILADGTFKLVV
jgi:ATP-dependent DNA helicase